jgi:hypothetical protein
MINEPTFPTNTIILSEVYNHHVGSKAKKKTQNEWYYLMRLNQLEFSQIKIKSNCYIIARDIAKLTLAILKLSFEIELDNIYMSNV